MANPRDELIPTRATLIQRLKNWQDQSSWQNFFDIYWELIYCAARKSGLSKIEAQDVVQETMISVAKKMPAFKYDPSIGSFKAWLRTLTRWRIVDQFRKRGPLVEKNPFPNDTETGIRMVDKVVDPLSQELDRLWDAEWKAKLLEAAMAKVKRRVDPQKFQIFDLYVKKKWDAAKVAKTFAIPVAQVYLAKHRVTDVIKEEVERLEKEMA